MDDRVPTLRRRELLRISSLLLTGGGMALLAACGGTPGTTTTASSAPSTAAASASSPAGSAAGSSRPSAAGSSGSSGGNTPGKDLVGTIEGPTLITDPAQFPKQFNEAPSLAEQVKAGKLPPVAERIGQDPLVIKPLRATGKYGGTWRRGFTGPADNQNGHRVAGGDRLLFWDAKEYPKNTPNLAKDWKVEDEGKTITVYLRKGAKWSDGQPFTANDIMFWYEDVYNNTDLVKVKAVALSVNGKPGTIVKVDDFTIQFKFESAYPMFVDVLGSSIAVFGGNAIQGQNFMGGFAPKHYMQQFHQKYVSPDQLAAKIAEAKVDNWVNLFKLKNTWHLNPDLPVMTPWKTTNPANTPTWTLERNPYYFGVDDQGNQLPYIDKITMTLAENLEVLNLRAIAGEYDVQSRHLDMGKVPVFLENQQKGNYKLSLDPASHGADAALMCNQGYEADPEIAKWLTNKEFRIALSHGIDRNQLNETFWLGVGTPGSPVVTDDSPYNPGKEYRAKNSTLDIQKANDMLDKLGLTQKDGEGYRQRSDGKGRLRIELQTISGSFLPFTQIAEMINQQWKKIGIQADVKEVERSLGTTRLQANETQIYVWQNDGSDNIFLYPDHVLPCTTSSGTGPEIGKWFQSGGTSGKKPTDPQIVKALELLASGSSKGPEERIKIGQEIWKLAVDELWAIGTVGLSPAAMGVRVTSNKLENVPSRHFNVQDGQTPNLSRPSTFFFKS
jgi:peptide/nickel transport system substrate-binding protein